MMHSIINTSAPKINLRIQSHHQDLYDIDSHHQKTLRQIVSLGPDMRKFAIYLCRNSNDADDLVQETALKAISKSDQYQPNTNLRAWLYTIMRNNFYTSCYKRAREKPGDLDCASDIPVEDCDTAYWHLRMTEVSSAMRLISPHLSQAIKLVAMDGYSYQRASEIIGCNIGTLKSRVNRGRAALRNRLGEDQMVTA
ncbi:RNA polymerase subunit sigma [Ketogulonicigenium vulgare]|uniref:RNA polymerase sigma factor n=2 Tax=Ketogulonicigenium vulgare TaxID=92945 RepID=F9Y4Q5_KETVW|nr:RNA polymerase sigma factor [Ketogulonicigenium vulgare WSH-001]ALJ80785.1 RNA polymerase subunit sigma [Ketogulonicigenium vulgare]ANW33572.1 RNA polymerase subunit sigma [Ketogulonicigenium vulgare]